jgi:hypothetical protein
LPEESASRRTDNGARSHADGCRQPASHGKGSGNIVTRQQFQQVFSQRHPSGAVNCQSVSHRGKIIARATCQVRNAAEILHQNGIFVSKMWKFVIFFEETKDF